jgi:hypothetical protein
MFMATNLHEKPDFTRALPRWFPLKPAKIYYFCPPGAFFPYFLLFSPKNPLPLQP